MLDEQNKKILFADAPGVAALTYLKQLYAYSPSAIANATNSFATGHVAMLVSGPWEISDFKQNFPDLHWGAALLPMGVRNGSNIGGEDLVVYKAAKHQALAWEWLKYLTGKDANRQFNDSTLATLHGSGSVAGGLNEHLEHQRRGIAHRCGLEGGWRIQFGP